MSDALPESLRITKIVHKETGQEKNEYSNFGFCTIYGTSGVLEPGEKIEVYITVEVLNTYGNKIIEYSATITGSDIDRMVTNKITNTIKGTLKDELE